MSADEWLRLVLVIPAVPFYVVGFHVAFRNHHYFISHRRANRLSNAERGSGRRRFAAAGGVLAAVLAWGVMLLVVPVVRPTYLEAAKPREGVAAPLQSQHQKPGPAGNRAVKTPITPAKAQSAPAAQPAEPARPSEPAPASESAPASAPARPSEPDRPAQPGSPEITAEVTAPVLERGREAVAGKRAPAAVAEEGEKGGRKAQSLVSDPVPASPSQ